MICIRQFRDYPENNSNVFKRLRANKMPPFFFLAKEQLQFRFSAEMLTALQENQRRKRRSEEKSTVFPQGHNCLEPVAIQMLTAVSSALLYLHVSMTHTLKPITLGYILEYI